MPPRHGHRGSPPAPPFPTYQLTILAICRFSEPIAFCSILAYSYVMVQDLNGGSATNASFYAGSLLAAYAVAEACTAMGWGAVSDRVGRKPVVLLGLCGVALSSLLFGLAQRYWVALLARFVGGALNGNVAVMQTMVAEMVTHPDHEPTAYAVQPFVWILGSIVGSAMGGFLAQPAKFYPDIFPADGLFGRFPYLLPNLVAMAVVVGAVVLGILCLDETNPRFKTSNKKQGAAPQAGDETAPLLRPAGNQPKSIAAAMRQDGLLLQEEGLPTTTDPRFDLRRNSFGTMHSVHVHNERPAPTPPGPDSDGQPTRAFNFAVIMLIISLVIAASHQIAFGSILPIYLLDAPSVPNGPHLDLTGGMGFTLHDVGTYLAVNGFIALFAQAVVFPIVVERTGVWLAFALPVIATPLCYVFMPFLSLLRGVSPDWLLSAGIYAALFFQNLCGIVMTPCALILLKNACPSPLVLGRVNGLAMSAVCAARTVGSPLVGVVYDAGGSAAAWGGCAAVAVLGAVQLWWVPREQVVDVHVENPLLGGSAVADDEEEEETANNGS